jgi:hypothetical protein
MAISLAPYVPEGVHGDLVPGAYKEIDLTVTGSASYTTGGDPLTVATLPVPAMFIYDVFTVSNYYNGTVFAAAQWNASTGKLQAFWTGAAVSTGFAEVTSATNMSAYTAIIRVRYR